jgi:hypothetical protein
MIWATLRVSFFKSTITLQPSHFPDVPVADFSDPLTVWQRGLFVEVEAAHDAGRHLPVASSGRHHASASGGGSGMPWQR